MYQIGTTVRLYCTAVCGVVPLPLACLNLVQGCPPPRGAVVRPPSCACSPAAAARQPACGLVLLCCWAGGGGCAPLCWCGTAANRFTGLQV